MCAVSRLIAEESAMLSYIPVILVVGIYVGSRAELQCLRVGRRECAQVCAVCVRSGSGFAVSGLDLP